MKSIFKNRVWLVLTLLFCLSPAFAVDYKDFIHATPTSDFIDNGDGTVTHKITGLTWMRCSMGQTWTGSSCSGNVTKYKLDKAMALTLKGDWRLPNIDELLSIVEKENQKPTINTTIFPDTPIYGFWSSSPSYIDPYNGAWLVSFSDGYSGFGGSYDYAVRLVRGGQWTSSFLEKENNEIAQEMYLAAGKSEREGSSTQAKETYEMIISRFPDSVYAVKANDQLLQINRVTGMESSARESDYNSKRRAYDACKIEMDSCYASGRRDGCYRDCDRLL
ncbi:MAG: DUF1566 domain-containing protein [Methylococcales bacterium]|nr:DUF1566 domain-containing protein [Methylococcales bacterium]